MRKCLSSMPDGQQARHHQLSDYFHYLLIVFGGFLLLQSLIAENCRNWPLLYKCVKYADEVFAITGFLFVVIRQLARRQILPKTGIEWPLVLFLLVAITSSVIARVPLFIAASQFILYIKGFLLFYIFANLSMNHVLLRKYIRFFSYVAFIIFALGVVDFVVPRWFRAITGNVAFIQYRAGIPSVKSVFIHPTVFGWFMSFIALFVLAFFFVLGKWRYFFLSILFSYGVVFSMRCKAILGLLAGTGVFAGFGKLFNKKNILFIVLFYLSVIVPNYNRISYLFSSTVRTYGKEVWTYGEEGKSYKAARNALYFTSFKIAVDYLPLGAGLGRYGSWMSRVYYSPLYDEYELSGIRGLSRDKPNFINDTFWPMVLGETGFVGIALYAGILILFLKTLYKQIRISKNKYVKAFQLGTFMILIESLAESVAQPVYVSPPIVYFIFGSLGISYSLTHCRKTVPAEI